MLRKKKNLSHNYLDAGTHFRSIQTVRLIKQTDCETLSAKKPVFSLKYRHIDRLHLIGAEMKSAAVSCNAVCVKNSGLVMYN